MSWRNICFRQYITALMFSKIGSNSTIRGKYLNSKLLTIKLPAQKRYTLHCKKRYWYAESETRKVDITSVAFEFKVVLLTANSDIHIYSSEFNYKSTPKYFDITNNVLAGELHWRNSFNNEDLSCMYALITIFTHVYISSEVKDFRHIHI